MLTTTLFCMHDPNQPLYIDLLC